MSRLRYLAVPLTPLYRAAVRARAAAYNKGWRKAHRFPIPVVSVGNITFGGTGKTPTVIALVRDLIQKRRRPAVLTRGYGRQSTEPLILVGPNPQAGPREAGDEPLEIASRLPGVPIVVDADRIRGGTRALDLGVDILVLDDGFQHLPVARDLNLALLDSADPWGGGRLPPRGRLREPMTALQRADAALVTKLPPGASAPPAEIVHKLHEIVPDLPVFGARFQIRRVCTTEGHQSPDILRDRRVFAIAGVARPGGFLDLLEQSGATIAGQQWFPDHHKFEDHEVRSALSAAKDLHATVVTTAKDAVKLAPDARIWTIEVSMQPLDGNWDRLWASIPEVLR